MRTKMFMRMTIALALVTPLAATAASERPGFKKADANGNGKVEVSEATEAGVPESEAKREDIDNDGKLSKADWKFVDMNPGQSSGSSGSGSS